MRVVAGTLRGRHIEAPPGTSTRPTTDKVREAMFNALGSLDLVRDAVVVDAFAGSGAIGIEALSRGAAECVFIERDRGAVRVLRGNLATLGVEDRSRVFVGDALVLASREPADVVFADPPYGYEKWDRFMASVGAPFVVAESGRELPEFDGWDTVRSKRYGRTWLTFLERPDGIGG